MNRLKKFLGILLYFSFIGILPGCTSAWKLQTTLNSTSHSMSYLMSSQIVENKKDVNIGIDTVYFASGMNDSARVIRKKAWMIPLVFAYIWNSQNVCIQGKTMIKDNIPDFFRDAFVGEIKRSGNFNIDTLNNSDLSVELSINYLNAEGPYVSKGYTYSAFYIFVYSKTEIAGPAISNLSVSYKLRKNDQVICSNTFVSEMYTEQINRRYNNRSTLIKDYGASMVEATSNNFKNVIELIINDINDYLNSINLATTANMLND